MSSATNYWTNNFLVDHSFRALTTPTFPTEFWVGLLAIAGTWTASTPYTANQIIVPTTYNGSMYVCTTGGTSGTTQPTWTTTAGATQPTDGTVVWKEMTLILKTGVFAAGELVEASYGAYARIGITNAATAWTNTQNSGTGASTGITGTTTNASQITFAVPTSSQSGQIGAAFLADASTSGNVLFTAVLATPKTINNGDAAPDFPAGALQFIWT